MVEQGRVDGSGGAWRRLTGDRWFTAFLVLTGALAVGLYANRVRVIEARVPSVSELVPELIETEYRDLALEGVLLGTSTPAFDTMSTEQQGTALHTYAALLQSYMKPDFGAFLLLRKNDVALADENGGERAAAVAQIAAQAFGLDARAVPSSFVPALSVFYERLYERTRAAEVLSDKTQLMFFRQGGGPEGVVGFTENAPAIVRFKQRYSNTTTATHSLAIPHRVPIEELLEKHPDGLDCLDVNFQLRMSSEGTSCIVELLTRFAWNPDQEEWFLYAAVTGYPDSWGPEMPPLPILM